MIHLFERAGLKLVLDVGSGAVHVVDDTAFALLSALDEAAIKGEGDACLDAPVFKKYERALLESGLEELRTLAKQGLLYADDDYTMFAPQLGPAPVKALCLHIAHDCNLRCQYCFASTGDFGGARKLMGLDVAQKAIDVLVKQSGSRVNLEVDFFGGEPLMNFDVVRQTVQYARSIEKKHNKNFRFTITTNGVALSDENIAFINEEMGNVVLSLDGRKEVNDSMRPMPNQKGSYDIIVPKMQRLVAGRKGKEYYVRGTYTRYNTDFSNDVLSLYSLGFDQISVEPVVGPDSDDYTIRDCDIAEIEKSYEHLMMEMALRRKERKGNFNFFHFMIDLDNGPCAIKRLKGCGCGNEYLAVTPDGELYPCHQFVGKEEFCMGNVEDGIVRADLKNDFAAATLLNKKECSSCWAKFYCSGGCNANNHAFCGDILQPHKLSCTLEKIRLECAIALKAMQNV